MQGFTRLSRSARRFSTQGAAAATSSSQGIGGMIFFGSICATTFGLGCWQTKRYFWKVDLIEETQRRYNEDMGRGGDMIPEEALTGSYEGLENYIKSMKGKKLVIKGEFDHSREVLLGPRGAPPGLVTAAAQGMATNPQGYFVLTPFTLADGGHTIFVNRGWIPKAAGEGPAEKRELYGLERPEGQVTLSDVIGSSGEERGRFAVSATEQSIRTRKLLWLEPAALELAAQLKVTDRKGQRADPQIDLQALERAITADSVEPAIVEVISPNDAAMAYPAARRYKQITEFSVTPETHATYALTWFSLSLAGIIMSRRLLRGGGVPRVRVKRATE